MRLKLKTVPFRRKQEGKTNYYKRLRMLRTQCPRLIVRPALANITAQIATYNEKGDIVVIGVTGKALEKYGWSVHKGNVPSAYLVGYLLGKMAITKNVKEAVLDTGLRTPVKGGRIYACVKGLRDAGVHVPVEESILPPENRINGQHIAAYAQKNKERFSDYARKMIDPAALVQLFTEVKKKIGEKS
ncbi:50S ribosomal protein L18 [Candidatus Woesearchaeota archaeon]|nr:50S ribosomal protein L18 [Candidatus Woesearchaeota archaeon]